MATCGHVSCSFFVPDVPGMASYAKPRAEVRKDLQASGTSVRVPVSACVAKVLWPLHSETCFVLLPSEAILEMKPLLVWTAEPFRNLEIASFVNNGCGH